MGVLDGLKFLEQFPYGCLEQQFSALMPHLYLKQLYEAVGEAYDLHTPLTKGGGSEGAGGSNNTTSIAQALKDLLLSLHKYQNTDGGMVYRETNLNRYLRSDLQLSVQVLNNLALLRNNNYSVDTTVVNNLITYVKAEFYRGNPNYCPDCKYTTMQNLEILDALLSRNPQDTEIEKMYNQLSFTGIPPIAELLQARVSNRLYGEKVALAIISNILNNDLVMNSKGAFLEARTLSLRVQYTAELLRTIAEI